MRALLLVSVYLHAARAAALCSTASMPLRAAALLRSPPSMMADSIVDAIQARLNLKDSEMKRMLKQVPAVADCDFNDDALSALQARLSLSEAELKAVVQRLPQVLCYNDYAAMMAPSLDAVQARLQLADAELAYVVKKLPQMIGLDYATAIEPSLAAMQQEGGLTDEELKATVLERPSELLKAGVVVRGGTVGPKGKAARAGKTTMIVNDEAPDDDGNSNDAAVGSNELSSSESGTFLQGSGGGSLLLLLPYFAIPVLGKLLEQPPQGQ